MLLRAALVLALLSLAACDGGDATKTAVSTTAGDGLGLVIQPDDSPLARGVTERDTRPYFHDFGTVRAGDTVEHVFRVRNEDPRPVAITKVDPGCGCTVASLRALRADGTVEAGLPISSKAEKLLTLAPGEVGELAFKIVTRDITTKNAHKLVTTRVLTDSPNGYFLNFELHVFVEDPFVVLPGTLLLGRIPENGGGEGKLEIVPAGGFQYRVTEVLDVPSDMHAAIELEIRNQFPVWTLRAGFVPPLARGPRSVVLKVGTEEAEGVPGRPLEVRVTAQVVGDLDAEPERLVFAAPRATASRSACELFSRLKGQRLRVLSVAVPEEHRAFLSARFEPVELDDAGTSERWRVTLETVPPLPPEVPMVSGALAITLEDPQHPSFTLDYVLHLR